MAADRSARTSPILQVEKATKKMARGKPGIGKVDAATLAAAAAAADDEEEDGRGGDGEQQGDEGAAVAALGGEAAACVCAACTLPEFHILWLA